MKQLRRAVLVSTVWLVIPFNAQGASADRLTVTDTPTENAFPLVRARQAAAVYVDPNDAEVVHIAAEALRLDVKAVTGALPMLQTHRSRLSGCVVIVGTLGRSPLVDQIARTGAGLALDRVRGKWETFVIGMVDKPLPEVQKALVVAGSDRRGTAFGVFELSAMTGVSPWVWWADVAPKHKNELYVAGGSLVEGPPSVKYRGIFLNDEDWGLQPWAAKNMDTDINDIGPKTYARVFELLLRLKANYIWPAMHPCTKAFYHYPDNPKTADAYAIVVGSSHCEPMLRNNIFEWSENFEHEYGVQPGEWRYDTNRDQIRRYWEDRVKQAANYESVFTVGMRGIHDSGMPGPRDRQEKVKLLEQIIGDQRGLLTNHLNKPTADVPQIFCPYKEVLSLYQAGLKLPDDVTIAWADDNHGYIRQLPNPQEQQRGGTSGVYYHLSYWGVPQDFLWLCSVSPSLISYEMTKAYRFGASRLWVFNVGDIKPAEMEIQFAMDLAWNVEAWPPQKAHEYAGAWAARTFGDEFAEPIAKIKSVYYRLAQAGKPEHLATLTFTAGEAASRLKDYQAIAADADAVNEKIPESLRDAFFELVLYPVQAACAMNEKILYARRSIELAGEGDESALQYATKARAAFDRIQSLTRKYNEEIAGGKWSGMMSCHPRDLPVFDMPEVATPEGVKGLAPGISQPSPAIVLSADGYASVGAGNRSSSPVVIEGLGIGGKGLTVMPFDGTSSTAENAPYAEYKVNVGPGSRRIIVKCLPTHRVYEGLGLRYAISVNGDAPQVVDVDAPAETRPWSTNVLRGFCTGETTHQIDSSGVIAIRLYLLDPGLAINELDVL
jgi:hypothetical protein